MNTPAGDARRATDTVTPTEPPLEVVSAAELTWADEADVVVVGWGAAGA